MLAAEEQGLQVVKEVVDATSVLPNQTYSVTPSWAGIKILCPFYQTVMVICFLPC